MPKHSTVVPYSNDKPINSTNDKQNKTIKSKDIPRPTASKVSLCDTPVPDLTITIWELIYLTLHNIPSNILFYGVIGDIFYQHNSTGNWPGMSDNMYTFIILVSQMYVGQLLLLLTARFVFRRLDHRTSYTALFFWSDLFPLNLAMWAYSLRQTPIDRAKEYKKGDPTQYRAKAYCTVGFYLVLQAFNASVSIAAIVLRVILLLNGAEYTHQASLAIMGDGIVLTFVASFSANIKALIEKSAIWWHKKSDEHVWVDASDQLFHISEGKKISNQISMDALGTSGFYKKSLRPVVLDKPIRETAIMEVSVD